MVSIIVPVYNAENSLQRCLDSLMKQDYNDIEIILVDDGSTDSSAKLCDSYDDSSDRIVAYHKENGGVSSARNYGMKKMTTEGYVMFVDSDDYVEPDYVSKLVSVAERTPNCMAACKWRYQKSEDTFDRKFEWNERIDEFSGEDKFLAVLNEDVVCGYPWNKIFNKQILREHNIVFNESLQIIEDLLFVIQYLNYVEQVVCINFPLYHYIYCSNSLSHSLEFNKSKWLGELITLKKITSMIPDKYQKAKEKSYKSLFNESIYFWIRMYKSGLFECPNKVSKKELIQMKRKSEFVSLKYKIYYYGVVYCPVFLFLVIHSGMVIRFRLGKYKSG